MILIALWGIATLAILWWAVTIVVVNRKIVVPLIESVAYSFFVAVALTIVGLIAGEVFYDKEPINDKKLVQENELLALQNVNETEGSISGGGAFVFVVGGFNVSGSVENELHYIFYHKDENNEVVLEKREPHEVRLFEEDRQDAVFRLYKKTEGHHAALHLFGIITGEYDTTNEYHLRVPEGTVKRTVSLDIGDLK